METVLYHLTQTYISTLKKNNNKNLTHKKTNIFQTSLFNNKINRGKQLELSLNFRYTLNEKKKIDDTRSIWQSTTDDTYGLFKYAIIQENLAFIPIILFKMANTYRFANLGTKFFRFIIAANVNGCITYIK